LKILDMNNKYNRMVGILRSVKPRLTGIENIEDNIIRKIRSGVKQKPFPDIFEILFGWIYVRWIRYCMVSASLLLMFFFIFQQTMIIKGINSLNERSIINGNGEVVYSQEGLDEQVMILKLNSYRFSKGNLKIPEKQIEQLLESYSQLQDKYSDLVKIIEEDPVLKEYIEKKLGESRKKKPNL
jgi:hypothetical protein